MDRIKITPILRGAFMQLASCPVTLRFDDKERADLPPLEFSVPESFKEHGDTLLHNADARTDQSVLGADVLTALSVLREEDGSLPSGVCIPGLGSFFCGLDYDSAEEAKNGLGKRLRPAKPANRLDIVRGRIALVTGGAQGFGAEIARYLADQGSMLIIADINLEGAECFAEELNADGTRRAIALQVDVSDEQSVKNMAEMAVKEFGGLDLVVSNAGVLRAGSVLELSAADFDFVTKINYSAFYMLTKHTAAVMIGQQSGGPSRTADIIQINSKSGLEGSNKNGAYAGSKFGGLGLVQSFAMELVEYGIKVNAICPGNFFDGPLWSDPEKGLFVQYLQTGKVPGAENIGDVRKFYEAKVPMGRGCRGADVAKAILYCVEQDYETGQAIPVTGGQVMLK